MIKVIKKLYVYYLHLLENGGKMELIANNYLKRGIKIIAALTIFILLTKPIFAIDIPEYLKKCVLAIGTRDYDYNESTEKQSITRDFRGTGVLIWTDRFILVTAKHVVFENGKVVPNLCFWGNTQDGNEFMYSFSDIQKEYKNVKWIPHSDPNVDIAASIIMLDLEKEDLSFVRLEGFENVTDKEIGNDVYCLGYPSGIGATKGSNPVIRKGIIAHKDKGSNFFHIDAIVSGGNSGGPVFLYEKNENIRLLGIVSAFRAFFTNDARVYHSGLGIVFSADCIKEILESSEFKNTY